MATITKITNRDGTISYRAQVRIKQAGRVVFSEAKTFKGRSAKRTAENWGNNVERQVKSKEGARARELAGVTVASLIERYIAEVDPITPIKRTKRYVLQLLIDSDLGGVDAFDLSSARIIEHCRERRESGAGPATIAHDVSYLASVLGMCEPAWGLDLSKKPVEDARPVLAKMGLIAPSKKRERRPTSKEITKLLDGLKARKENRGFIPMTDIVELAIYSAMRQTEITSILWRDLDKKKRTIIIRDRKHPSEKIGNNQTIPLLGPAWEIVSRQPVIDERIFPYNSRSVGAAFTRVCAKLNIIDLRFHDLRHEAASRLFEMGFGIHEVALVTGHRNWNQLKRYTQLDPAALHRRAGFDVD